VRARASLLFVTLLVVAAALVPAAAQAGGTRGRLPWPQMRTPAEAQGPALHAADPIGPFSIGGTVLDYDGTPMVGAGVYWGWFDPNAPVWFGPGVVYHEGDSGATGLGGAFSFTGVTSSPGNDDLGVEFPDYYLSTWTNDFSTKSTYVVQPALVPVTIANGPARATADVSVGDAATGVALTQMDLTDGSGVRSGLRLGRGQLLRRHRRGDGGDRMDESGSRPRPGHRGHHGEPDDHPRLERGQARTPCGTAMPALGQARR